MNKLFLGVFCIFLLAACCKVLYIENNRFYSSEIKKQYDLGTEGFRITILKGIYTPKKLYLEGKIYDSYDRPIKGLLVGYRLNEGVVNINTTDDVGKFQIVLKNTNFDSIELIFGGGQIYVQREFRLSQMIKN